MTSPLKPDYFTIAPFFCLLPERNVDVSVESYRPVFFARLEQIEAQRNAAGGAAIERDQEIALMMEEAMLRELLNFSDQVPDGKSEV